MVFVTKWPWVSRDKHKTWASVFIDPVAHALIDAVDPTRYKIVGHILVQQSNISRTSQNQSRNTSGFLFVYV